MSKINVGVKLPDVGTPDSVEGIATRTGGVGESCTLDKRVPSISNKIA